MRHTGAAWLEALHAGWTPSPLCHEHRAAEGQTLPGDWNYAGLCWPGSTFCMAKVLAQCQAFHRHEIFTSFFVQHNGRKVYLYLLSSYSDVVTPQTFLFSRLVPCKEGLVALLHHFSDRELPSITMSDVAFCLQIWAFLPGSWVLHSPGTHFLAAPLDCPLLTHNKIDSALVHVCQSQDTVLVMRQKFSKAYIFLFAEGDI